MCRYAFRGPYKIHYVCFSCRKGFKQPSIEDYLDSIDLGYAYRELRFLPERRSVLKNREAELGHHLADLIERYNDVIRKCPECGAPMADVGRDLKTPRQSDVKAWKAIQGLYRVGHAFHTCGCDGPGWIPQTPSEYRDYLATQKKHYEEQLAQVPDASWLSAEAKKEAIERWRNRIEAIEQEQANMT